MRRRRETGFGLVTTLGTLALIVLVSACGGGGGGNQVATLGGDSASGASDNNGSGSDHEPTEQERQDAFRKYAQCMREHGVEMADPQFNDGGGVTINGGPAAGSEQQDPQEFEAADKACQKHLKGVVDGRKKNIDPEQEQKMKEQALAFAKCMREHGVDMPDPQFDSDGGRFSIALGSPGGGGPDPNDPNFQKAQETCSKKVGMELPGGKGGKDGGGFSVGTKDAQ